MAQGRTIHRCQQLVEPLSNLDAALRAQTRLEIAKLHHDMTDVTMVYVTHDQVEAMTLADRICVLRDGEVEQVGTPAELYENPNSLFVASFIGLPRMNFLTDRFGADFDCTTIGIRPEHISITTAVDAVWQGRVIHAEDLGSDHFLFVEIGLSDPLIVRQNGKLLGSIGDTLSLRPISEHLHRFGTDGRPIHRVDWV